MRSLFAGLGMIALVGVSACTPSPNYEAMADSAARGKCDQLKTQTNKLTPWVECYNTEITNFYAMDNLALPETKRLILMKSLGLAPKVDAGQMNENEFNFEISNYQHELNVQQEQLRLQREETYRSQYREPSICKTRRYGEDLRVYCY